MSFIASRKKSRLNTIAKCLSLFFASLSLTYNSALADSVFPVPNASDIPIAGNITKNVSSELDQITKEILLKELELGRLNTRFRMETTLVSPWRQRRVFLYGEANACTTEAASINAMPIFYKLANPKTPLTPARINQNRTQLVAGTRVSLVGQCVGMGGDIFELGLNFFNYLSIKNRGFNPKAYAQRVHVLRTELDSLIEQRQLLLANTQKLSREEVKVAESESKLLNDIRDLSLIEYSRFHSATKRFWTFQNTAFLVDFAKNGTGATANIIGLAANHLKRRRMLGGAGVVSIVNGVIILITPAVGRVTGNLSGLAASRTASKELTNVQAQNTSDFSSHKNQFFASLKSSVEETPYLQSARRRQNIYNDSESSSISMQEFLLNQRKRGRGTLRENIIFASIVAPPRINGGVAGVLNGWKYYKNRVTAGRLSAAAATGNAVGSGFAILETARVEISSELYNRKLAKTNLLPRQQFTQRLRSFDEMEKTLK